MAGLSELIPYLTRGYSLRDEANNVTLTPRQENKLMVDREVRETKSRPPKYSTHTLEEIKRLGSMWEWSVVFVRRGSQGLEEYTITELGGIEQAIQENRPHATFGKVPTI